MSERPIVCLDPGHGPDTVNGSPDGSYREQEFAWDMYARIAPLLEEQGVEVVVTRTKDTNARGLMIYTSSGPMTAPRNVLASDLVDAFCAAGVLVRGNPIAFERYTVLVETEAPAALIEYGFHTSREDVELLKDGAYREKLAEATARGICSFLGVAWTEEPSGGVAEWAEEAWEKATEKGVMDGTRPTDPVTRQELAVVLDRLGLI